MRVHVRELKSSSPGGHERHFVRYLHAEDSMSMHRRCPALLQRSYGGTLNWSSVRVRSHLRQSNLKFFILTLEQRTLNCSPPNVAYARLKLAQSTEATYCPCTRRRR